MTINFPCRARLYCPIVLFPLFHRIYGIRKTLNEWTSRCVITCTLLRDNLYLPIFSLVLHTFGVLVGRVPRIGLCWASAEYMLSRNPPTCNFFGARVPLLIMLFIPLLFFPSIITFCGRSYILSQRSLFYRPGSISITFYSLRFFSFYIYFCGGDGSSLVNPVILVWVKTCGWCHPLLGYTQVVIRMPAHI